MSTLELGIVPEGLKVRLSQDAPFVASIGAQDQTTGGWTEWPADTQLRIEFRAPGEVSRSFDFSIAGPFATISVPELDVNTLANYEGLWVQLWLTYPPAEEFLWCVGEVTWSG